MISRGRVGFGRAGKIRPAINPLPDGISIRKDRSISWSCHPEIGPRPVGEFSPVVETLTYYSRVDPTSPIRFAAACGATSPLDLVIEKDTGEVVTRGAVDQPCAMIGRDQYCEIVLSDVGVSARHAFLQVIGGRVFVADLDSRAGTRWADRPKPDGWLAPDAPVQVGPFQLHLSGPVSEAPHRFPSNFHPLQPGPLPDGYPRAAVEFRNGKVAQSRWEINRVLTLVGRARACKINLASDEVSLFHAYFLLTPDGVWLVDLYGRGGVLVNGEPIRYRRLVNGDDIRIAKFSLSVAYENDVKALPLTEPLPMAAPLGTAVPDVPSGFPDVLAKPVTAPPVALVAAYDSSPEPDLADVRRQLLDQVSRSIDVLRESFDRAEPEQVAIMEAERRRLAALTEEIQALQNRLESPRETPLPEPGKFPAVTTESADIHGQMVDRLAALNTERNGVWQRLIGIVSPKSDGD
jgi:pSer/pThr/pTyr-binding forkhead associated (FHA) protein